MTAVVNKECNK